MALSTTLTQCAPQSIKFGKKTQNKGHFAVQGHSRSPILVSFETSYTASYIKTIARHASTAFALSLQFIKLLGIYTVVCSRLLLDIVIVNCP